MCMGFQLMKTEEETFMEKNSEKNMIDSVIESGNGEDT